jgi:hypothetical protein
VVDSKRGYAASRVALELEGARAGWPMSAVGGDATSDVVAEKLGTDSVQRKHIGGVRYTDILLTCGLDMEPAFWAWLADALEHRHTRHSGAIVFLDYDSKEQQRITFNNALVAEIGFPALDAASKEAGRLTVRLRPETVRRQKGGGASYANAAIGKEQSKKWLTSNFRVTVSGLDLTYVSRVEALTVDVEVVENAVGILRDYQLAPVALKIPDLELTVAESRAASLRTWHEDFLIMGNNGEDREKTGSIEMLSPTLKDVLIQLDLKGVGIFSLEDQPVQAGSDNTRRLKAKLYCEEMRLAKTPASGSALPTAGPPAPPEPPPSRAEEQTVDSRSGVPIGMPVALAPPELGLLGRDLGRLRPSR